jgi:hypothetical protein
MDQLDALELLLRYDLVLLDSLQNPTLADHIDRVGKWIFVRKTS